MTTRDGPVHLPPNALALWRHTRSHLDEALRGALNPGERLHLGGGTVLAADWNGHRQSHDIDFKLETRGNPSWSKRALNRLNAAAEDLGADAVLSSRRQFIIRFGTQAIDIFRSSPLPKRDESPRKVDNRTESVLSHAQIIHGKLHGRGTASPTRDLYDIAVAKDVERPTIETVVNTVDHAELGEIAAQWEQLTAYHQRAATTKLLEVPDRFIEIAEDPAAHAVEAVLDTRYRRTELVWRQNGFELRAVCHDGQRSTRRLDAHSRTDIRSELSRSGIRDYIESNTTFDAEDVARALESTRKIDPDGEHRIFDTGLEGRVARPQDNRRPPTETSTPPPPGAPPSEPAERPSDTNADAKPARPATTPVEAEYDRE